MIFIASEEKAKEVARQTGADRYYTVYRDDVWLKPQKVGYIVDREELKRWVIRQIEAGRSFKIEVQEYFPSQGWQSV